MAEGQGEQQQQPAKAKPPKKKPAPKAKPDKAAPRVCSSCGKKWAQYDKDGLCAKCAQELADLPPVEIPPGWPEDKPPPTPQEIKRGRIFEIAQLMASGEWRASMAKTLAKAWSTPGGWQVSVKTVQHYSAEASRLVDYTTGQREKLVNIARLRLLQVLQQDESDRVAAARTLLEHMGELRQNMTVKPADPFEGWSDEEVQKFADSGQKPERFGPKARGK